MELYSTRQRNTFFGLSATEVLVLGRDGNLWLESGPWGTVPPSRQQVDGNVAAFSPTVGNDEIYVLGRDGNLWLESGPWGTVPPARKQVDAGVVAFQPYDDHQVLVLGKDGNLWLESGPWGTLPPSREWVDGNVADFQANGIGEVVVLGNDGRLWRETAPFGQRNPIVRSQVDFAVSAFQVLDDQHVYVAGHDGQFWYETQAIFGFPGTKSPFTDDIATFQALSGGQLFYTTHDSHFCVAPHAVQDAQRGAPSVSQPIDSGVNGFQMLSADQAYVLAADGALWFYSGQLGTAAPTKQQIDANVQYLPYFSPLPVRFPETTIQLAAYPNENGLNGNSTVTIAPNGAWTFSGSFKPSNPFTGLGAFDVTMGYVIRDSEGYAYSFGTSGTVPQEGSYDWNQSGTNATLARRNTYLQQGYSAHYGSDSSLDIGATLTGVVNWFEQNEQTISEVIDVVGPVLATL